MKNTSIDHIVLQVEDFEGAANFYRTLNQLLCWQQVKDRNKSDSLGFRNEEGFTLWIDGYPNIKTGEGLGYVNHFAIRLSSKSDVDEAFNFCQVNQLITLNNPQYYPDYGNFYGFALEGFSGIKIDFLTR